MKTIRNLLNLACILALVLGLFSHTPEAAAMDAMQWMERISDQLVKQAVDAAAEEAPASAPQGLSDSEWTGIQAQILAAEYRFAQQEQAGQAGYRAFNRAQGFSVAFDAQGFRASSPQPEWEFGLTLSAYGEQAVAAADLSAEGAQVTALHGAVLSEWYENRPEGVKHGLTLYAPPVGELTLDFALTGSLLAEMAPGGGLRLRSADGATVLAYDGLVVYDASGRELPASMALIPGGLRIAVDGTGAVYPLTVDPLLHSQTHFLTALGGQEWDQFGYAVAIDGDTLVVGMSMTNMPKGTGQVTEPQEQEGYAVVFQRNQGGADAWGEVAMLTPSNGGSGDEFGYAVGISGDTIVVGAPEADGVATGAGAAYVYYRNQGGADAWGEVKILYGSTYEAYDHFGVSVAIDGDFLVVGAENKWGGYGWAYVFQRNLGGLDFWGEARYIYASDNAPSDFFGHSVAIAGDTIVVGVPAKFGGDGAAYIFQRNQGGADNWGEVAILNAIDFQMYGQFGDSVAIDADTVVIGAPGASDPMWEAGAAYVFQRNQGGADAWGGVTILRASDAQAQDHFGCSVAIAGDAIVVSADSEDGGSGDPVWASGAAYVFNRNQGGAEAWGEINILHASTAQAYDAFGSAVAMSGNVILVGASGVLTSTGAAYLFNANGTWMEALTLHASEGQAGDHFGWSVAVDGDTLVVGAPNYFFEVGAVYVFQRNFEGADLWGEVRHFVASNYGYGDRFGEAVAISGDWILVGAPYEDGDSDLCPNCGAAYIFWRNQGGADTWGEVSILHGNPFENAGNFGASVAFSGETLAIGAPGGSGSVYIFQRNWPEPECGEWCQSNIVYYLGGEVNTRFGSAVALDGSALVVGAPYEDGGITNTVTDSGAAYIFQRNQGGADNWGEVKVLYASDAQADDMFGRAVGLDGSTVVVGAPYESGGPGDPLAWSGAAYVFERNQGGVEFWGEVTILRAADKQAGDSFGVSAAISGDTIVVGAPNEAGGLGDPWPGAGAAYIFSRNQGGAEAWGQVRTLRASDAQQYDHFGYNSVAISGNTIVVGAPFEEGGPGDPQPGSGAAYLFTLQDGWEPEPVPQPPDAQVGDLLGSVALDGNTLVAGAPLGEGLTSPISNTGAAYIYDRIAGRWRVTAVLTASNGAADDYFGWAVAIYSDTVVVGAPYHDQITGTTVLTDAGAVYVFQRNQGGADAWGEVNILYPSTPEAYAYFGYSVAIESSMIVVGAYGVDGSSSDEGAVYVFAYSTRGVQDWGQIGTLNATPPQNGENFGYDLSLSGDTLAVGAPGNSDAAPGAGAVHLFTSAVTTTVGLNAPADWGQIGTLNAGGGAGAGDGFGSSVSLGGSDLVVGAPFEDGVGDLITDTGAAYIFNANNSLVGIQDWGQIGTLGAGGGAGPGDQFGTDVAISGQGVIVGAPFEDGGSGDPITDTGAAYVFVYNPLLQGTLSGWEAMQTLRSMTPQDSGYFGSLVALDSQTVAIGAPYEDGSPTQPLTDTGAAYIYSLVLPNIAPLALDDEYEIVPGSGPQSLDVLSNDSDANGEPLVIVAVGMAGYGTTLHDGISVLYTPPSDYIGMDTFTYMVTDGNGGYATAWVRISVIEDLVANDQSISTPEDISYHGTLTTTYSGLGVLGYSLQVDPLYGTVMVMGNGVFTYTPALNYYGADAFTFIVSDGVLTDTGQVMITVISVNDAPQANDQAITLDEDTAFTGMLTGLDVDSDPLTYTIGADPLHGTLLVAAGGALTYTPALNYTGADAFTFIVSDGVLTDTGQVSITVTAVDYSTVLAMTASPSPSGLGQVVTFTALVSTSLRAPNGMVTFLDGAVPLLTIPLGENGVASYSTDALALGDHAITAEYLGAEDYLASSAVLTHTVAYMADLQVSISAALQPLLVTYVVEVYNPGFNAADGTQVTVIVSPDLTEVTWTCDASGNAVCTPSGTGNVDDILTSLPVGGRVTYTITARRVDWQRTDAMVIVTLPAGFIDPNPGDNQATYPGPFRYLLPLTMRNR